MSQPINYNIHETTPEEKAKAVIVDYPPVPCDLKVGDKVTFTNEYGVVFPGHTITGFAKVVSGGRFVHMNSTAWWFADKPEHFTKEI